MTPAGQNYPIHEHDVLFWVVYLGAAITLTMLLMGVGVMMIYRASQATRTTAAPQQETIALPAAEDVPASQPLTAA